MADVNVLLTCAGQRVDIVLAFRAALAAGPHTGRVLVSDLDPLSPSLFHADGVVALPPVDDPGLRGGGRRGLPHGGRQGGAAAHRPRPGGPRRGGRRRSGTPARVAFLPSAEVALGCQDKWACHVMLTERGLPSPPTWLPDDADPAELPYPVLLKPRLGFAARHIYRCNSPEELAFFRGYSPAESVVQQAPARPRVQHRLLRRPRRAGARRRAAGDDPEQGRRADQGRDARRPPARGARRGDGRGPRPGRAQHGAVLPRGRPRSWGSPTSTRASAARSRCRRPPAPATSR